MKMSGIAPRPWVKLWRDERGSFAQLPLYTRALAAELLKIADANGRIGLGHRTPAEGVCWLLGATRSDRRLVKRCIGELIEVRYLRHDFDARDLVIVNWSKWQADEPDQVASRLRYEAKVVRDLVIGRDGHRCRYCGVDTGGNLHVDHVIPIARGGNSSPSNLVVACPACNLSKGAKTPEEWLS